MRAKIAVCASGNGANFEAIVRASQSGALGADVVGLIVNRAQAGALQRAQDCKIPHVFMATRAADWDLAMVRQLEIWQADWVALAGFLALIGPRTLAAFPNHIVNIHPSLLPKFGGPGMYGERVHAAVLQAQEAESGVTVHLVNRFYDQGQILVQERVAVLPGDTVDTLAQRVKALEVSLYPRVLNDLVTGQIEKS